MKKSVYSLVLMDDVVSEVDKVAYSMNTSRSNMINQILAEYVSLITPEKKMQEVFDTVESLLVNQNAFQVLMQPSYSMMSLRSALSYKYNPSVKYSVELYTNIGDVIGELKVSLRTQNNALILYTMQFFKLWVYIEQSFHRNVKYIIEDGKFIRKLIFSPILQKKNNSDIGELIAEYIHVFDKCLKVYFDYLEDPQSAAKKVEQVYLEYINKQDILI